MCVPMHHFVKTFFRTWIGIINASQSLFVIQVKVLKVSPNRKGDLIRKSKCSFGTCKEYVWKREQMFWL